LLTAVTISSCVVCRDSYEDRSEMLLYKILFCPCLVDVLSDIHALKVVDQ